ncbi:4'-phosphopantetheinyl transferase family protein [Chondromyces apiculatus]|uniref:4'-phosphopantetheinyl transferase n=1 Tax=Chondromyces apiculatus DSM 436 TaxID=1192034 RepID=A0A017SWW1_9BACT|nr:4'-phosphopantetheinyl transferase superfamily protein [Chondromyces apiculatus]EYF01262.1 4'-phosphopantetheinyl transferase [Chondromyces apiculatus DSM 436]
MLDLPPRVAHLWYVFHDDIQDPALLAAYRALMTPEEAERQARFYFPKGRHEHLVTRALVRTTLSRYAPVDPRAWRFIPGDKGRPEIAAPTGIPPLRFNLSHTEGLIACLVTLDTDVGVDVEFIDRPSSTVEIADRFFSPEEVRALHTVPPSGQRDRFFDYWTLKESYIKARGMGLSLPLEQFTFLLGDDGPAAASRPMRARDDLRIAFDPRLVDDPESWQFALWSPSERHRMAAAIRKGRGAAPFTIELRQTIPLSL